MNKRLIGLSLLALFISAVVFASGCTEKERLSKDPDDAYASIILDKTYYKSENRTIYKSLSKDEIEWVCYHVAVSQVPPGIIKECLGMTIEVTSEVR